MNKHISVIISSCLVNYNKIKCLFEVLRNINFYLPNSEIIIGFDKKGPNEQDIETINKFKNIYYFEHDKGLGYSFNKGNEIAKNEYILQTEDDWIIQNPLLKTYEDFKNLLSKCIKILEIDESSCVRLDGGMFDEIGGSMGYPLGYQKLNFNNDFFYYKYNLPTDEQMKENNWLKYAFCNHPHLKKREITIKLPYPENVDPGFLENNYSINWIEKLNNIYYVAVNEEIIFPLGIYNGKRNIFRHIGSDFSYRN